jgi:hypothetical protein
VQSVVSGIKSPFALQPNKITYYKHGDSTVISTARGERGKPVQFMPVSILCEQKHTCAMGAGHKTRQQLQAPILINMKYLSRMTPFTLNGRRL